MAAGLSPVLPAVAAGLAVLCFMWGLRSRRGDAAAVILARTSVHAGVGAMGALLKEPGWRQRWQAAVIRLADRVRPFLGLVGGARLRQRLAWAGQSQTPEQFLAGQVLAAGGGLVLGALLALVNGYAKAAVVFGLAGAAVGWWVPAQQLESRYRAARGQLGREALGFADFLVAAVQAGLPLEGAIERLGRELPGRLPTMLSRAARESAVTREPLDMTLTTLAEEVDERHLSSVIGAIVQARQTGGDLAGPLGGLVTAMRQDRQQQLRANVRGRAAYSSLPLILVMLPGVMLPLAYIVFASFRGLGF